MCTAAYIINLIQTSTTPRREESEERTTISSRKILNSISFCISRLRRAVNVRPVIFDHCARRSAAGDGCGCLLFRLFFEVKMLVLVDIL